MPSSSSPAPPRHPTATPSPPTSTPATPPPPPLGSPPPCLLRRRPEPRETVAGAGRARDSVAEWLGFPRRDIEPFAGDLVRPLAPAVPPRGKLSSVRRATYAVEAVSGLIAVAVVAVLGCGRLAVDRVPADFTWADEYHKVAAAVSHKLPGYVSIAEMEAVKAAVRKLTEIMDVIGPNGDKAEQRLHEAAKETEKATHELTEALDALSNAVNELFHSALVLRNTASDGFRRYANRCATKGQMWKST
ncbi:hypothetical protein B296_00044822 [Ensete ventricosum]|uniref:Uncharacterized protein n=1 Tax=Ensete ventricosum TaxID=4639 RepID=A0A426XQ93_ENSVE|nr:hypothetical protein B296_00044822 [Ensete ventricosum]